VRADDNNRAWSWQSTGGFSHSRACSAWPQSQGGRAMRDK